MRKYLALAFSLIAASSCCSHIDNDLTAFVDPMIGSGGHGHVFVGASVPFGMVQVGPTQMKDTWDWCSGYHCTDTLLIGFSHTHLSGTGIGDLGDILLMPIDEQKIKRGKQYLNNKKREVGHIYATLDHDKEEVRPGFYSLEIPDYGVKARISATKRVAIHEYTFSGNASAILLDLCTGIGWDSLTVKNMNVLSRTKIEGFRRS
ncbi:MAG: hypothetical protein K5984_06270, partial [Bacteroidales bacterium]|nr:hypothetical protein [Bacteroidales bacterium]